MFTQKNINIIKSKQAFTLIEVVLAMMVLASGLLVLSNAWSGTFSRLQKTQIQVQIAALLERKIVEIEREYKDQPLDSIPEEKEDNFGSELEGYNWKMESQMLEVPDFSGAIADKNETENADLVSIMRIFTEHINKSIKEVKITVTYTKSKRPISADVVIYIVNYDRPLPVPGTSTEGSGG